MTEVLASLAATALILLVLYAAGCVVLLAWVGWIVLRGKGGRG